MWLFSGFTLSFRDIFSFLFANKGGSLILSSSIFTYGKRVMWEISSLNGTQASLVSFAWTFSSSTLWCFYFYPLGFVIFHGTKLSLESPRWCSLHFLIYVFISIFFLLSPLRSPFSIPGVNFMNGRAHTIHPTSYHYFLNTEIWFPIHFSSRTDCTWKKTFIIFIVPSKNFMPWTRMDVLSPATRSKKVHNIYEKKDCGCTEDCLLL